MKIIINKALIGAVLVSVFSLTACDSYIEEENYTNLTAESFLSQTTAPQLLNGVYSKLRDVYKNDYDTHLIGTDIFTATTAFYDYSPLNDYFNITSGEESFSELWKYNYDVIAAANTVLNRYEDVSWDEEGLKIKAQGIAEAKALRALSYFNLVQQFGGVVLILDEVMTIEDQYTRATEEETYTQIIKDLEEAMPDLPITGQPSKMTQRGASHLLAEVYLTRGYKSYGKSDDFSKAARLAETAIGNYDIMKQSYSEVFDYDNQINDEILFSVQFGAGVENSSHDNTKHSIIKMPVSDFVGISRSSIYGLSSLTRFMPTTYFYNLFDDNDSDRENATIHRVLYADEEATFSVEGLSHHVSIGDTVIYFPKHAITQTDLADKLNRYYVYQPGEYYYDENKADVPNVIYKYSANTIKANFPIFAKFEDPKCEERDGGYRDIFVYRVATSHLVAAEAYLKDGDGVKSLAHLNKVHERATGNPDYYNEATLDNILKERALELAGESSRWCTLKRMGKLEERINLYNPHVQNHGAFKQEYLLRPIPSHEMEISGDNGDLQQNPGY